MATLESIEIQIDNLNSAVNLIIDELKIIQPENTANYTESMLRVKYIYDWIGVGSVNGTGMWLRSTLNSVNIKSDKMYNWLNTTTPNVKNFNNFSNEIDLNFSNLSLNANNILSFVSSENLMII